MTAAKPGEPRSPRDLDAWARPVERLVTTATGADIDRVTGRRVSGPIQGFGQMWQKTFRLPLTGVDLTPSEVIAGWKDQFPSFWPDRAAFYAPLRGITPGEVALLDVPVLPHGPVRMSTGVMVIYADAESFAFMTPEGHVLSAWITFSAFRDGESVVAQVQALERTSDPLSELAYLLGGSRMNDRFWEATMTNLATSMGVTEPVVSATKVCVDRYRQWRYVRNIGRSPVISSPIATLTAPIRAFRRRRVRGSVER